MQARRIARELSLLSISQLPANQGRLDEQQLQNIMLAAVRTLTTEVQETLENAAAEIKRGSDRLLSSETRASDVQSARAMVKEALELAQTAINRVGMAVELPELIQLTNQKEVRAYTLQVISTLNANTAAVDELPTQSSSSHRSRYSSDCCDGNYVLGCARQSGHQRSRRTGKTLQWGRGTPL